MDQTTILGIKIDKVTQGQALEVVRGFLQKKRKHTIFTPNIEFIMAAQKDITFKKILNSADLSIADSSHFGWSDALIREKSLVKRILLWPLFPFSKILFKGFPVVTGVDFMEKLCSKSRDWGFSVGFLGGNGDVADKAAECLLRKYPNLKVSFTSFGGEIDERGNSLGEGNVSSITYYGKNKKTLNTKYLIPNTDVLFVAFGAVKQEKWIVKNKDKVNARIFMGVGGAFDYLSGETPRAPKLIRDIGFEWLFRLVVQPWRIKRFAALVKFVLQVMPEY